MTDVAIIGGGPVGIFSIFACGLEGLSCVILDSNNELGGQCKALYGSKKIYDIPAYKAITGDELINNLLDQISIFNYDVFLNSFVSSIEEVDGYFKIKSGEKIIESKSVIIALGAGIYQPIKLSTAVDKSIENDQILYHIYDIKKFQDKEVAILGGGDSAVDWANELSNIAAKVHLIHRRDTLKSNAVGYSLIQNKSNIVIHAPYFVESINKNGEKVSINNHINVDYILPCYGYSSNINFLNEWNLKLEKSKILVEAGTMKTSREGIYAIGDCVQYPGKRNLIVIGFSEAMFSSRSIFKYLNPKNAFNIKHSTHSNLFK